MKKLIVMLSLTVLVFMSPLALAQTTSKPKLSGDLKNDPAREEEFMDWGLGMFVHWSFDSQLGSVISHSMDYASRKYLDRYVNELLKTFNPTQYDPDKWMEIAKLAGVKYMVLTTKHHSGFCMWNTKTTDFSIMHTPYGKDIVRLYVDACRRHGMKVGYYYSPEDFAFNYQRDVPARGGAQGRKYYDELGDVYYTQSKDGKYVYAFLTQFTDNDPQGSTQWGRSARKEVLLKELKAPPDTEIRVLGQEPRAEKFTARHDIGTRFKQTEDGLEVSVKRAQRLYNNRRWPNAVVLRLENVEFAK